MIIGHWLSCLGIMSVSFQILLKAKETENSDFSTRITLISTTIMLIIEFYIVGIHSDIVHIKIEEHKCNPTKIIGK